MARWNKIDIPHKRWRYIGIEEKNRYVHIWAHPEFEGELRVGCDCVKCVMMSSLLSKIYRSRIKEIDKRMFE